MSTPDFDQKGLEQSLSALALGSLRYYPSVTSTNTIAAEWLENDAPDLALVVADEQTAGRGRQGRVWFTPAGAALAFSLILRLPPPANPNPSSAEATANLILRCTALGALAVCDALRSLYRLPAQIKWPNDVLLERRKFCGILAEAHWQGTNLQGVILGIGVNVFPAAVPPENKLLFPATCIQSHTGQAVSRSLLLKEILSQIISWRVRLAEPGFITAWEDRLAYRSEWVSVFPGTASHTSTPVEGKILGLDSTGRLVIEDQTGSKQAIQYGELHLRPDPPGHGEG